VSIASSASALGALGDIALAVAFPCSRLSPSATLAAANSALCSASLVPTVCSLPKSHCSLSTRVKDNISSAARTWRKG